MSRKNEATKCKKCGEKIKWANSPSGNTPCNFTFVPYWLDSNGKDSVVAENGELIKCDLNWHDREPDGVGRIPHWVTCPYSKQIRR